MTTTDIAPLTRTTFVACPPERAFAAFTGAIGQWWPLESHSVYGGNARSVAFEDGFLVERSAEGRSCTWGQVLTWNPPTSFSMTWHPGREAGEHTEVVFTFSPEGDGTRVDLEHTGWEIFGDQAVTRRASYADALGWDLVLTEFTSKNAHA
jgi:hypothetical protein